jgi:hypothetical protein
VVFALQVEAKDKAIAAAAARAREAQAHIADLQEQLDSNTGEACQQLFGVDCKVMTHVQHSARVDLCTQHGCLVCRGWSQPFHDA